MAAMPKQIRWPRWLASSLMATCRRRLRAEIARQPRLGEAGGVTRNPKSAAINRLREIQLQGGVTYFCHRQQAAVRLIDNHVQEKHTRHLKTTGIGVRK